MIHILKPQDHAHFWKIGLPKTRAPFLRYSEEEWQEAHALWSQHRHLTPEEIEVKARGHIAWAQHHKLEQKKAEASHAHEMVRLLKWLILALVVLVIVLVARPAHAQFSHINTITGQNNDGSQQFFFASPFVMKAGSNCSWNVSGAIATFNCSATVSSVAWDAIINPTAGGLALSQFANGNDFWIVKRKTDTLPTGSFFRFQTALGGDICALSIAGVFSGCSFPYANVSGTPTLPANTTATAHNFFTAYNSSTGAFTKAQPACGDLSDAAASCATDATNAANIGSGTLPAGRMPALTGAVTSSAGAVATSPGKADVLQANQYCADAGASDTYACNLSPAVTAYVTGTHYWFKANTANTGAASINFNAVGALTIKKPFGGSITADLADNDIRVGQIVECVYDGTNCQMVSQLGNTPAGGSGNPCTATASSVQFNNAGAFGCASQVTSDGTQIAAATSATKAGFNLPSGTAPTTPLAGDFWHDTNGLWFVDVTGIPACLTLTDSTQSETANNIKDCAPSSVTTAYQVNRPAAASSGYLINVNASNVETQSFSGDSAHSIVQNSKTALISTATLCAATAGTACGQIGTYHVHFVFWGSGTACATVTAGQVTFLLTWTDENTVTHSAVALMMHDQTAAAVITEQALFHFETALANEYASGDMNISTNGSIIQYATGYTACTSGTGTYNLRATVTQIQ